MKVEAYAKINLTLEVFGRRLDGYHSLRSVVVPISLADTLEIELTGDGEIVCDSGYADDLCVRAARALYSAVQPSTFCIRPPSVRIHVEKRIPVGGGLGGGSADAAAVLRALNDLWQIGLSREELAAVGSQVGSDVPALVLGGAVLMEGRGEDVKPLTASAFPFHLVLVNPGVASSTKEVYAACVPREASAPSATEEMVTAIRSGDLGQVAVALQNDLQIPAVRLHPEIGVALDAVKTAGATGVMMSGSGSCVFGLVPDETTAVRIAESLTARGYAAWPVHTL